MVDAGLVIPGRHADVHEAPGGANLGAPGRGTKDAKGDLDQLGGGHARQDGQHDGGEDAAEGATAYRPPRL
jgi:hypothetical protein